MDIDKDHSVFAKLASGAYDYESDRSKYTDGTDYVLHPNKEFSNHSISTYVNRYDPKHIVIAHRGTAPGSKGGRQDIGTDIAIGLGIAGDRKRMRDRQAHTERIIKQVKPTTLHLTGHSLGGSTVNNTIANSKIVKRRLTSAHTYNAGAHPVFANNNSVNRRQMKRLQDKIIHHRVENDSVSAGLKYNVPFGRVKTYKHPNKNKSLATRLAQVASPFFGLANRSLNSHSIDLFH